MKRKIRYISLSLVFHSGLLLLICVSPQSKKSKRPLLFKEKFVAPIAIKPPLPVNTSVSQQTQPIQELAQKTFDKPVIESSLQKKSVIEQVKPSTSKPEIKPSAKSTNLKNNKSQTTAKQLEALTKLADTLSQHLEKSAANFADISLLTTPQLMMSSSLAEIQEKELCELFRNYVALPSPGEVRIKLTLSPSGVIEECLFLSSITPADKQLLINRIYSIPFQQFFSEHKVSKNISFHIKLLSKDI
ncbi:inclusion-associated protein [Chlamydia sp. 17-3921]|uniref:inclusion-associated protein n=1 Tax=Chlamydia sp. 17-3921 TaxID=2675798 RepID=UPI001919764A|nr:inclusion-associated protein [Chlamydia sp. 17-3921]